MQKLIVVLGPTATGKSDLAVQIAKDFGGEIISADSRQVYKGLDVGSGKITKKEMRGVPHHLLDVASPKRVFTVAQFKTKTEGAIKNISTSKVASHLGGGNKTPIICGGTGFYIDAVVNDLQFPEVLANSKLRKELEKKSLNELGEVLKKLDKDRFENIDQKNKVRLIRAIEIAKELGKVPKSKKNSKYGVLFIGLDPSDKVLKDRIYKRIIKRLKGMKAETRRLRREGLSIRRMKQLGLEYRYLAMLLEKEITEEEFIETLNTKIWQFAKRQRTWFKRNKDIKWFAKSDYRKIKKHIEMFLCPREGSLSIKNRRSN
jgi:tRNA dimethylallyltransferase